jgi:hypothetical protein
MKHAILSLGVLFLLAHAAFTQNVSDPTADFLSKHVDPSTGELFSGEQWNGRSNSQPPGGYVLRFEAPIGPNGSPVLFIAASILADQRTSTWSAYTRVGRGNYTLAGDEITFGAIPRFYLLKPNANGMRGMAEIIADKNAYSVLTYYLDKTGHLQQGSLGGVGRDQDAEDSDPRFEDKEMAELLKKDKLSQPFTPMIQKILLAEYLKDPSAKWRSFNTTFGVASQYADPNEGGAVSADRLDKSSASALLRRNIIGQQ